MTQIDPNKLANKKAKGKRPYFFKDPDVERLLSIIMSLAGEVSVLRERQDTVERLLDAKGTLTRADIDAYEPDVSASNERTAWREAYLSRLLRIVEQEMDAAANPEINEDVETIAKELREN